MPLFKQNIHQRYQWGIWKVTESIDELMALLPDNGEAYAADLVTLRSESRRLEWLAVRVLLYVLTKEICQISYQSNGRPFLPDDKGYISISHTKGYVSVIISKTNEVGIDIEKCSDRVQKVAHKYVREDEETFRGTDQYTHALLLIWSAKEVMFKCMDQEGVDFREHLYVDVPPLDQSWMMGRETHTERGNYFLIHYTLYADFVMTWTVC